MTKIITGRVAAAASAHSWLSLDRPPRRRRPRRRLGSVRLTVARGRINDMGRGVDYGEPRFVTPICTVHDVATLVGMPLDTVKAWAGQRTSRRQMITRLPQRHRGWPSVPLVGLAEAHTLRTLRELLPKTEVDAAAAAQRERWSSHDEDHHGPRGCGGVRALLAVPG